VRQILPFSLSIGGLKNACAFGWREKEKTEKEIKQEKDDQKIRRYNHFGTHLLPCASFPKER
jgi:hypothetical protein